MARKLKTYQTSLGFFDLAIAAPSMKAALQAWGSDTNLFHQGFARETDDPAIVAATLAKPGVVLRRPVGSDGAFSEHAELPKELPVDKERTKKPRATTSEAPAQKVDAQATREAAALAFERERKRREQAIAKAETALEEAKRDHEAQVEEIERERAALDRRSQAEDAGWAKQKTELEAALRRARD
jgi:hypothetical protein